MIKLDLKTPIIVYKHNFKKNSIVKALSEENSTKWKPNTVSMFDALKVNGPGPELINARIAMVALPLTAYYEIHTSEPALYLLFTRPIIFLMLTFIISYATLIPITKGTISEPFGIFTPNAELLNGRLAMLGFALLLFLETKYGACFF